jgi:hypothetical protein
MDLQLLLVPISFLLMLEQFLVQCERHFFPIFFTFPQSLKNKLKLIKRTRQGTVGVSLRCLSKSLCRPIFIFIFKMDHHSGIIIFHEPTQLKRITCHVHNISETKHIAAETNIIN